MNFILCRCSNTLRDVAEESESGQLLNVTDLHILPLRTTVLMIQKVGGTYGCRCFSAGKSHLHDTLEVF